MPSQATYPLNDVSLPSGGVVLRSSDKVEFKVYKNILALASPFFKVMFSLPKQLRSDAEILPESSSIPSTPSCAQETIDGLPVIDLTETGKTLSTLLRMIYPTSPAMFKGLTSNGHVTDASKLIGHIEPVLEAALKYDMTVVVQELCTKLLDAADHVRADGTVVDGTLAVRMYTLACRFRLEDEARRASFVVLRGQVRGVFFDGLRVMNAAQYFRLLEYHEKAVNAVLPFLRLYELPDYFRSLVKCARCHSGQNLPREREPAACWLDFMARAEVVVRSSPRTTEIFSSKFMEGTFTIANKCTNNLDIYGHNSYGSNCERIAGNWQALSQHLREQMEEVISKVCYILSISQV